ncbi:MAG: RagB/SusD family nutrient uptake outer membrane protein [Chitinophagaceae bacterium]|nr:RagB/SusD family nutrient uptake outer membrane protein [Chitinophagaceae bacterium]
MKIKSIIISTASLFLLCTSCKKSFLDEVPYDQISSDLAINSESDMQTALNGAYASFRDADLVGRTLPLVGDLMADNVSIAVVNSNRYLAELNYSYTNTFGNGLSTWSDAYAAILSLNNIINANIPVTANASQMKGEALTLRALMYFYLIRLYAKPIAVNPNSEGVPIVLSYDPNLKPSRNSTADVYAQIINDLNDAFGMMSNTTKNSSYVSKYVAKALLAKVLLTKGDFAGAKTAALDVVNNGGYSLTPAANFANYWHNPVPVNTKVETIFEISTDAVAGLGNTSLAYFYDQAGYGDAFCTDDLYNQYSNTDVRKSLIVPGLRAGSSQPIHIVKKYTNVSDPNERDNFKILRYADVILILAEAYANTNDDGNARIRLNQLAQMRDPSFGGYSSSGDNLKDDILNERRKELAFEGDRYYDLLRLNIPVIRTNLNNNYSSNTPLSLSVSSDKRIWPIPQVERDANPNISQNPGY